MPQAIVALLVKHKLTEHMGMRVCVRVYVRACVRVFTLCVAYIVCALCNVCVLYMLYVCCYLCVVLLSMSYLCDTFNSLPICINKAFYIKSHFNNYFYHKVFHSNGHSK